MFKKAIIHFEKNDPVLFSIAGLMEPFELEVHPDPFMRLTRSIVGQQLSVKAARTIFSRFEKLFNNGKIEPEALMKIPDTDLRTAGISYQKIKYLKDLAEKVSGKEIELGKLSEFENDVVIEELVRIKGIGQWTAEMFLMFTLGRPDVFSYGDLGLQNAIMRAYKLRKKPTVKQMEKISIKWTPYRTYAARILWASLDNTASPV
jgi:DNA-3-methyladenine glycosylase II